jgi:hypothetical protein
MNRSTVEMCQNKPSLKWHSVRRMSHLSFLALLFDYCNLNQQMHTVVLDLYYCYNSHKLLHVSGLIGPSSGSTVTTHLAVILRGRHLIYQAAVLCSYCTPWWAGWPTRSEICMCSGLCNVIANVIHLCIFVGKCKCGFMLIKQMKRLETEDITAGALAECSDSS